MMNIIRTYDPDRLRRIMANISRAEMVIDRILGKAWKFKFPKNNFQFLGLSGGVDSTVLAVILLVKHWQEMQNVLCLFTDTGVEPESVYELFKRLELEYGLNIVQIKEQTLFGMIEDGNGFLPSPQARSCTARLKIDPYDAYIQARIGEGDEADTFVGIHYDERDRRGTIGLDNVVSHFPFVDCEVTRDQIIDIGVELGLVNDSYAQGRTRSGCVNCIYLSKPEHVAMYFNDRKIFDKTASYEKLEETTVEKLKHEQEGAVPFYGLRTHYPAPKLVVDGKPTFMELSVFDEMERTDKPGAVYWEGDLQVTPKKKARRKKKCTETIDMFASLGDLPEIEEPEIDDNVFNTEEVIIYAAVEFLYYPDNLTFSSNHSAGIPMGARLVTYSTSQTGLTNALNPYFFHRAQLARLNFQSEHQYRAVSHIAVFAIHFQEGEFLRLKSRRGGYTWYDDRSFAETEHAIRRICRTLQVEASEQVLNEYRLAKKGQGRRFSIRHMANQIEDARHYLKMADKCRDGIGKVVRAGHFRPKEYLDRDDSLDETQGNARCAICSI
ncbi:phosphoadenosine phosphosulfate reductase domain-containing protein [Vibrio mediterranei]|uniref:phosphoadenosine phosphosulfate reductase domain-containing protein n=1 Tax=Vibrio mediterranei TaxID=689 RepID=UPI0040687971